MATKRVCFCGKPEMGKTTIKKVVFEGENPNELVLFPLEPTIGNQFTIHEFMDSKIILIDTPGQSLPQLLKDEEKQIRSFENAGAIIYIFDYPSWIEDSESIIDDIKSLYEINKRHQFGAKIILFLHKIDLLVSDKKIGLKLELIRRQINRLLELPEDLLIYFTSLHPNYIYTIHNALYDTIGNFSEDVIKLKEVISNVIDEKSKTICLVLNKNGNLIIQEKSDDFDNSILFKLHERINNLSKATEEFVLKNKLISAGAKILYMGTENISEFYPIFKYIIFLSETIERDDLFNLIDELKNEIVSLKS